LFSLSLSQAAQPTEHLVPSQFCLSLMHTRLVPS